jgi:methyl-accepting chemotaxis protein
MPARRRALVAPFSRHKVRLLAAFGAIAALALLLQHLLFSRALHQIARELPSDGELLLAQLERLMVTLLFGSFVVLLPITILVGLVAAGAWVGPLERMERFLRSIARGEAPEDLELRSGDELNELGRLLNAVTAPLRAVEGRPRRPEALAPKPTASIEEAA